MLPASFDAGYLARLELLKLRSRRSFLGSRQGGHVSLKRGHGIEFSDYRRYELGDNPRHIDWGLYGRSERLYVKRFQEEQDLRVLVLLDSSASMNTSQGGLKWKRSTELALSFAYVALMQHDKVFLSAPGLYESPGRYGTAALHAFAKGLEEIDFSKAGKESLLDSARSTLARVKFPGVAFFISDFLFPIEELEEILNLFRARNLDINCVQVNSAEELDLSEFPDTFVALDSEDGSELRLQQDLKLREEYNYRLEQHFRKVRELCGSLAIPHVHTNASSSLEDFVFQTVPSTGLLS